MLKLDPEIAVALAAFAEAGGGTAPPDLDDVFALRSFTEGGLEWVFGRLPDTPDVTARTFTAGAEDGTEIPMIWAEKNGAQNGAAVVYVHGGGMICGTAPLYDRLVRHYVQMSGVPFLSVDYRLAPEHSETGLARDVVAAVKWLQAEAAALGVDPERIAVMGDSGGGGVAAAAAIIARDEGIRLARQILIYPMLDDRNIVSDPFLAPTALWSYEKNQIAWAAVLGKAAQRPEASPYLAPARLEDFAGLTPAYIEVGELDIFRDESIAYAQKMLSAGISCELRVHPGAPHGHDWVDLNSDISRRVLAERARILRTL